MSHYVPIFKNNLPSGKVTQPWKSTTFYRSTIYKWAIFHGYVSYINYHKESELTMLGYVGIGAPCTKKNLRNMGGTPLCSANQSEKAIYMDTPGCRKSSL
jgi:hypothetical protein